MKNFVQPGDMISVAAPIGGVASGDGVLVGSLFGVAATTQLVGDDVELATRGVFDLAKEAGASFSVGDPVYWADGEATVEATSAPALIGVAVAAASGGAATVRVRLNGIGIA